MKFGVICFAVFVLTFAGCSNNKTSETKPATPPAEMKEGEVVYVCPMHPEVQSSKPGKCPKCGMHLVKKHKEAKVQ